MNILRTWLLWIYLVGAVHVHAQLCGEFVDSTGILYNIGALKSPSKDYVVTLSDMNYTIDFFINICMPVLTIQCNEKNVAGCQVWVPMDGSVNGSAVLGSATTLTMEDGKLKGVDGYGVTACFFGGTDNRSFEIDFICEPIVGDGLPIYIGESKADLHYNFTWPSIYGCPFGYHPPPPTPVPAPSNNETSSGLSTGSVLLIIFFVVVVVYVVGGILFNRLYRNATGINLIPNLEFWGSLPGLTKDGIMFVVSTIRGNPEAYQKI